MFNSEAGVEALSLLKRLFENKCAVEIPSAERFGGQTRFVARKALSVTGSSTGLSFCADAVARFENPLPLGLCDVPAEGSRQSGE